MAGADRDDRTDPGDIRASASVPIAYDDRIQGVLGVSTDRAGAFDDDEREVISLLGEITGLTITTIEREDQLQHERERLELVNRLLRHNLLNGLNLVDARLGMVDGHVDYEVTEHLETAKHRTREMIDLIETLRSLTEKLIGDDYELQAVDLGGVLEGELDRARRTYADASFDVRGDLGAVPAVLADDLLEEVFENLLMNAVQHNTKEAPRVTVGVDWDEASVTVRIRDNGPGVSDRRKEAIFEEGTRSYDSPGDGFGLHLAREIVNVYGGTIGVEDNDPEGAVFAVSLPREDAA